VRAPHGSSVNWYGLGQGGHQQRWASQNVRAACCARTVSLRKVSCGTELNVVQEGVPEVIPAQACHLGWQESLALLAQLVEAEVR
jgi:hypothetical protein